MRQRVNRNYPRYESIRNKLHLDRFPGLPTSTHAAADVTESHYNGCHLWGFSRTHGTAGFGFGVVAVEEAKER
ncbi:hypothetical protein GW17_00008742 [Ensete ventricosum]|nr:hypothetical protein GW17_00008742 [Ensete ventricosum]